MAPSPPPFALFLERTGQRRILTPLCQCLLNTGLFLNSTNNDQALLMWSGKIGCSNCPLPSPMKTLLPVSWRPSQGLVANSASPSVGQGAGFLPTEDGAQCLSAWRCPGDKKVPVPSGGGGREGPGGPLAGRSAGGQESGVSGQPGVHHPRHQCLFVGLFYYCPFKVAEGKDTVPTI